MQRPTRQILLLLILLLIFHGCNKSKDTGSTEEADFIKYKVVYLENMAGDIPTRMLPNEMEAYYSKRFILTRIQGFFGQFSLTQVANLKQNSVTTMLNFFGNKVYYVGKKGEIPAGIVKLNDPEVRMTDDTIRICGMLAYKAEIQEDNMKYNVYYTKDIDIKSPNITTPYNFIDYVLSDFRVQLSILKMRLIMSQHETTQVNSTLFEIPQEYEQVSRETMESIINSLFTKE